MSIAGDAFAAVPDIASVAMQFRQWQELQNDPTLQAAIEQRFGDAENMANNNPYGNVGASNNMFGTRPDGTPIGWGEAQLNSQFNMLNTNPLDSQMGNYQQLAGLQSPQMMDSTAGLSWMMGAPSQMQQMGIDPSANINLRGTNTHMGTSFPGQNVPQGAFNPYVGPDSGDGGGGGGGGGGVAGTPITDAESAWLETGGYTPVNNRPGGLPGTNPDNMKRSAQVMPRDGSPMGGDPNVMENIRKMQALRDSSLQPGAKALGDRFGGRTPRPQGQQQPLTPPQPYGQPGQQPPVPGGGQTYPRPPLGGGGGGQAPGNPFQQLMQSEGPFSQQIQKQMTERGVGDIQSRAMDTSRDLRNQAGGLTPQGAIDSRLFQNRLASNTASADMGRQIQEQAAMANYGALQQNAGLQMQGQQALSQAQANQNMMNQQAFNMDRNFAGKLTDSAANAQLAEQQRQMGLWGAMDNTFRAGMNMPNQAMDSAMRLHMAKLAPTNVSQAPPTPYSPYGAEQGPGNMLGAPIQSLFA